mgnify:CR=1 FL=1
MSDYLVEQIQNRMNQEEVLEVLDLEMEELMELLRDRLIDSADRFTNYLDIELEV